jgi:hypothetical protein
MPAEEYFAAPGLSHSGMKDLAVSPLRYWWKHLNPDREQEESTPAQQIGSALHCAVLEPTEFEHRYCCEILAEQYPGCLDTVDQMKSWLRLCGVTPKGTKKAEFISQVQAISENQPILEVLEREHATQNAGKAMFKFADWKRVNGAANALLGEPSIQRILNEGEPEACMFATDPDTGVLLKCRLDWFHPKLTADLKTFTQMRGKSIDQAIADALFYEGYLRQAELYTKIRRINTGETVPFVFPFVESEAPHEVRVRKLTSGKGYLYSVQPAFEIHNLIGLYAECVEKFGDKPWRETQRMKPLEDEEIKALAFS